MDGPSRNLDKANFLPKRKESIVPLLVVQIHFMVFNKAVTIVLGRISSSHIVWFSHINICVVIKQIRDKTISKVTGFSLRFLSSRSFFKDKWYSYLEIQYGQYGGQNVILCVLSCHRSKICQKDSPHQNVFKLTLSQKSFYVFRKDRQCKFIFLLSPSLDLINMYGLSKQWKWPAKPCRETGVLRRLPALIYNPEVKKWPLTKAQVRRLYEGSKLY